MRRTFLLAPVFLLASLNIHSEGANYQVFPQLKNLKVSYHVESRKKQVTLYATNHEKAAIICDSMLLTNRQEKLKKQETLLAAGKTTTFSYIHSSGITDVRIYLMCEPSQESAIEDKSDEKSSDDQLLKSNKSKENETNVIEEDLDKAR
jgi:hypothetical protein